jgi:hypothetical protein
MDHVVRYCVIVLTLMVAFMTGFFILVLADVLDNNRRPVTLGAAIAQTPRIATEQPTPPPSSPPRQEVRVQSSVGFFVAWPKGEGEEAEKQREKAHRIVYDLAAHECDLLLEVLAKECRLESVNNNINVRQGQQPEGFNVNGAMTFQVLMK